MREWPGGLLRLQAVVLSSSMGFLGSVQGTAVLNTVFKEYGPWAGDINTRELGSLVAFETGSVTGYALESTQQRGRMFVAPGDEVYEDQVRLFRPAVRPGSALPACAGRGCLSAARAPRRHACQGRLACSAVHSCLTPQHAGLAECREGTCTRRGGCLSHADKREPEQEA